MIIHIVMLKFKETNKLKNLKVIKGELEELFHKIEPLNSIEVGIDFMKSERSFDLVLTTKFDDKDGLSTYATHPAHLEVVKLIKKVTELSKVVDYEM